MSNKRELVERLALLQIVIAALLPLLREVIAELAQLPLDVDSLRAEVEAAGPGGEQS